MFVSIIICTRNRKEELLRICRSISPQSYTNYEIVIVDSSNKEKTEKSEIEELIAGTNNIVFINSEPGLTKQRNIGLNAANGDLFFFFDDDMILEENFLEEMVKVYQSNHDYYGGMGAFTDFKPPRLKHRFKKLVKNFFLLQQDYGNGKFHKSGFPQHPFGKEVFMETEVIGGAMMSFRREVFEEFKFDEHFSAYSYMEDVDISRRVSNKYKLFYNPKARAEHRHGEGGRGNYFENRRMYIYNHRYLFERNFPQTMSNQIAHKWSILGLYAFAVISLNQPLLSFKAYSKGLKDYREAKRKQFQV
ncbi:MAG: glycosyltransferase [Bacteroidota bacterium]